MPAKPTAGFAKTLKGTVIARATGREAAELTIRDIVANDITLAGIVLRTIDVTDGAIIALDILVTAVHPITADMAALPLGLTCDGAARTTTCPLLLTKDLASFFC